MRGSRGPPRAGDPRGVDNGAEGDSGLSHCTGNRGAGHTRPEGSSEDVGGSGCAGYEGTAQLVLGGSGRADTGVAQWGVSTGLEDGEMGVSGGGRIVCQEMGEPAEADGGTVHPGMGVSEGEDGGTVCPGMGVSEGEDGGTVCPGMGVSEGEDGGTVHPGMGISEGEDGGTVHPGMGVSEGEDGETVCPELVVLGQERNRTTEKSAQGDLGVRSKRRGVFGEKGGLTRHTVAVDSSGSRQVVTSGRSEQKGSASKGERAQRKEKRSSQKKAESKVQRRAVTVDSSKAKTSLEALRISIKQLGWKEFPLGRRLPCDIYWHGVSFHDSNNICSGQVNKFPGMAEMVRKINLSRAVRTMQELFPEEYDFYPQSWILPEEYPMFTAQVRMAKESDPSWKPTFIVKPDGGCQGDGIYLIKDPSEVRIMASVQNRPAVVQEYISKPLLMDKLKFDMRLYVVLRSLEPLEIYIAKDGLSRFCTEPYQAPNHKNLHRVYMHLTNYSLNIHSGNFIHSDSVHTGSKRTFSSILYRLSAKGIDVKKVWSDIISLVIKTIIALVPELKVYFQVDIPASKPGPTCFQILGFDILLLKNLKPILLEVNANPSMKIEHEQELLPGIFENVPSLVDEEVKIAVIKDTLRLVDPWQRRSQSSHPSDSAVTTMSDLNMGSGDLAQDSAKILENNLPPLCLKQIFPKYAKQFGYLRVVERIATLFLRFQGIRGTLKMGPTGFRTFIRYVSPGLH
ncbi:tubulin polyglutamylase TTLL11 isoform X2 [Aquarana catesbeiana]|uniref:tubulin polyglutamylase TTLL11 isoform X2 n=1 Tax=Aquarana catesbeiana TaxID=8400 RepID=UPI003CC9597F